MEVVAMAKHFTISSVPTKPIDGQKTGTSGLRKKVAEFSQPHYLNNWLQSLFNSLDFTGTTIVVGGDGRYWNTEAMQIICQMAAANGVSKVVAGHRAILSTPAVSAIIRKRKVFGGLILTASHNPGGPTEDFGIKYNCENGGPAPESVTNDIFKHTLQIQHYKIAHDLPKIDLSTISTQTFHGPERPFTVEVIDSCDDWVDLMRHIFDFAALKALFARKDFVFLYDGMHGVSGPYLERLFVHELGAPASSIMNFIPKEDFGGGHPDPNLTYAHDLVERMHRGEFDFGAASDGDADRNMVLGRNFFVNPSDSVAVIAANATHLPYYKDLKCVARSMPTSGALDLVAKKKAFTFYEVPTGWKFFGNAMDKYERDGFPAGVICGEESFGTGSSHVREKDGIWAVLMWLSIVAQRNADAAAPLVSVQQIVEEHWAVYGRNYFSRYDYENVSSESADKVMKCLAQLQSTLKKGDKIGDSVAPIAVADDFEYKDSFDGSVTSKQGLRFVLEDGSRIIFRLSGTGSSGATIRLYVERYESPAGKLTDDAQDALRPFIEVALSISKLTEFTGRKEPTVIT